MASGRPKGYIYDWNPQHKTLVLISQVEQVLNDFRAHLPLTARQIFYMLVGRHGYDKTEQAYARLCEMLVKARRAGIIDFGDIRDDGTIENTVHGYQSTTDWWETIEDYASRYIRDRNEGQDVHIEVWCEAGGMAPQLAKVAHPYGINVYSTGGFSSVTVTYETAKRVSERDKPTVFMHIGDYDPSGESIFQSMTEDIGEFVWADTNSGEMFIPQRVALTAEQVDRYGLDTAPPKRSDSRSRSWVGDTCQAEAMDPATLASTLRDAIEAHYDMGIYHELIQVEAEERGKLVEEVRTNL